MTDTPISRREFNVGASATVAAMSVTGKAFAQAAAPLDLVILNGRVMDPETGFDQIANVGVKDGRIVAITADALEGARQIDATGHVVAPGFIDTHFHWVRPMGHKLALRDGRTTVMDLEMGTLGTLVNDWYAMREGTTQINYGCASSHEMARAFVLDGITTIDCPEALNHRGSDKTGWALTRPDIDQGNEILRVIDEGLAAGAIAMGSTLGYMRECARSVRASEDGRELWSPLGFPLPLHAGNRHDGVERYPGDARERRSARRTCHRLPFQQPRLQSRP